MTTIITAQGHLLQARRYSGKNPPTAPRGGRGDVWEFSAQSRKRLLQIMATLRVAGNRVCFLTLTYHHFPTYAKAKQNLRAFFERVRRRFPKAAAIWRMELQERGSVHFHLMVFNLPYWKNIDIQKHWTEITGEDTSGIDIKLMKSHKHAMIYIGKYVAKRQSKYSRQLTLQQRIESMARGQHSQLYPEALASDVPPKLDNDTYPHALGSCGRHWGFFQKELLPFAKVKKVIIQDEQMERYLFWLIKSESRGKAAAGNVAFLFTDDALEIVLYANRNAQTSGKYAYQHLRLIQKALTNAERKRCEMVWRKREQIVHEIVHEI